MTSADDSMRLTARQELALRVALLPTGQTSEAWAALRDAGGVVRAPDIRELLPLLDQALARAGIDDRAERRPMRELRRATWRRNQVLFRRLDEVIGVLDEAGVATMALKGIPLALEHYGDPSLRPMADIDLLVTPDTVLDAVEALGRAGWTTPEPLSTDVVARTPEVSLRAPHGPGVIDLHWRLLPWVGRSWTATDPGLWTHATPLRVVARTTRAPAAEDLLLHVILHAFRSGWPRAPRWAADACTVVRNADHQLDWARLVERVSAGHLVLPVADALGYLRSAFAAPVPGFVLDELSGAVPTRRDRSTHRRAQRPITGDRHRFLGGAPDLLTSWSRISVNYSPAGAVASVVPFVRGRTRVEQPWTLPLAVGWRRLQRVGNPSHRGSGGSSPVSPDVPPGLG